VCACLCKTGCRCEFVPPPPLVIGVWDLVNRVCRTVAHPFEEVEGVMGVLGVRVMEEATMAGRTSGSPMAERVQWIVGILGE
jgi:hypothetical protein